MGQNWQFLLFAFNVEAIVRLNILYLVGRISAFRQKVSFTFLGQFTWINRVVNLL